MQFAGPQIRGKSSWTFVTSGTGGVGLEFVAASGGTVVLDNPSGVEQQFRYAAGGVGLSAGIRKIPKIGKLGTRKLDPRGFSDRGGGNVAPKSFWNHGSVFIMDGCSRSELVREDFHGICAVHDAGAGLILGYSGALMLVGLNPLALAAQAATPLVPGIGTLAGMLGLPLAPKAMILSRGWNVGPQASIGITAQLGYMWPAG